MENAKSWCSTQLPVHLYGFKNGFDYDIFQYVIDNEMISYDMCLDDKKEGLIRVSTKTLQWYIDKEKYCEEHVFEEHGRKYGFKEPETDPESMFIHEITEFLVNKIPEVLLHYMSEIEFPYAVPHAIATKMENINRKERGLKEWPEY